MMYLHAIVLHIEGYIRIVEKIIGKILFNDITFISTAYYEIIDAVERINFHDMP
jgi:hypothetical protein